MSQRAHFWLRILGLVAILATEFGPRFLRTEGFATNSQAARMADVAAR